VGLALLWAATAQPKSATWLFIAIDARARHRAACPLPRESVDSVRVCVRSTLRTTHRRATPSAYVSRSHLDDAVTARSGYSPGSEKRLALESRPSHESFESHGAPTRKLKQRGPGAPGKGLFRFLRKGSPYSLEFPEHSLSSTRGLAAWRATCHSELT